MVDIERRIKMAQNQAVNYRNYRRARERALTRLAQAYPDEYKDYLQEEKARDEATQTKWLDITGNTDTDMAMDTVAPPTNRESTQAYGADQGYDGGEA